ncbi:hypothetical protein MTO96_029953 [Rhipicephalus appendiculatus]
MGCVVPVQRCSVFFANVSDLPIAILSSSSLPSNKIALFSGQLEKHHRRSYSQRPANHATALEKTPAQANVTGPSHHLFIKLFRSMDARGEQRERLGVFPLGRRVGWIDPAPGFRLVAATQHSAAKRA